MLLFSYDLAIPIDRISSPSPRLPYTMISGPRRDDVYYIRVLSSNPMYSTGSDRYNLTTRMHHYCSIYQLREDGSTYHSTTLSHHVATRCDRIVRITYSRSRIGETIEYLVTWQSYHLITTRCIKRYRISFAVECELLDARKWSRYYYS